MQKLIILLAISLITFSLQATHLRCGQIRVEQLTTLEYKVNITVEVWTNYHSSVMFGGDLDGLDFGDGTSMLIPEQPMQTIEGLPASVAFSSFTVQHTYPGPGRFIVSYREPNRNNGVINFISSVNTMFYIETMFTIDPFLERYQTPRALHQPIFTNQANEQFSASLSATDPNNYALWYESIVPLSDRNTAVIGFQTPESFSVSPFTGLITWDTKFMGSVVAGEFLFAVKISQVALIEGKARVVGHMIRDYQVIVEDGNELRNGMVQSDRDLTVTMLEPDAKTSFRVFATHSDNEAVDFEIRTELPPASYSSEIYDSIHDTKSIRVARITFQNSAEVIRDNPYVISLRTTFARNEIVEHSADIDFSLFTAGINPFEYLSPVAVPGAESGIRIGPNPTTGLIDIADPAGQQHHLWIYNSNGKPVATFRIIGTERLDLSHYSPGLYLFMLQSRSGRTTCFKVIRE